MSSSCSRLCWFCSVILIFVYCPGAKTNCRPHLRVFNTNILGPLGRESLINFKCLYTTKFVFVDVKFFFTSVLILQCDSIHYLCILCRSESQLQAVFVSTQHKYFGPHVRESLIDCKCLYKNPATKFVFVHVKFLFTSVLVLQCMWCYYLCILCRRESQLQATFASTQHKYFGVHVSLLANRIVHNHL